MLDATKDSSLGLPTEHRRSLRLLFLNYPLVDSIFSFSFGFNSWKRIGPWKSHHIDNILLLRLSFGLEVEGACFFRIYNISSRCFKFFLLNSFGTHLEFFPQSNFPNMVLNSLLNWIKSFHNLRCCQILTVSSLIKDDRPELGLS